ncbi:MAG: aminomethyl-transferring glycine dehydrogenase subunit GcvPB [SAR202 cluster bacterium]|jgi:glycine dehydrogenase subunit 2|nr:aminomethyl-transferring glycine dehydrogenase subunit GcvPB [SAR202 cluster bacterium]|tara:strand:- start:184 stop:1674 length:1491 start_codon:yes stop_codon:yes gene_type:complete
MTSLTDRFEIDRRKLLMERSVPGRVGVSLPPLDVPAAVLPDASMLRDDLDMPEVSESELVRYFTQISQFNFSIDHNFYPLGSCTMKYNPKVNDEFASLPGLTQIHPLQPESTVQGALKLLWELQQLLAEITGMPGVSLAPMAGADGELAGMLMIRAYHLDRGDTQRKSVLIPDSAHGTNPASAAMAGFDVVTLPSDADGNTDLDALRAATDENLAGLMITLPSTLGLFDAHILEVTRIVREVGGLVYGDGANLNAILGRIKLSSLGFDVVHSNLHKTFSTPHGGGGPGSGPIVAGERLAEYLPAPVATRAEADGANVYAFMRPANSIGKLGAFHGNFGSLARAYAYILTMGKEGVPQTSEDAVINANYILSQLRDDYDLPYDRGCMHEVVLSARSLKRRHGVSALDVCKRLIDYGIHPPTMYFPLIVEEALMIEPTETESKETLDHFIAVMKAIAAEARDDPSLLHDAPHDTPNTRLDEARAARHPVLRWRREASD